MSTPAQSCDLQSEIDPVTVEVSSILQGFISSAESAQSCDLQSETDPATVEVSSILQGFIWPAESPDPAEALRASRKATYVVAKALKDTTEIIGKRVDEYMQDIRSDSAAIHARVSDLQGENNRFRSEINDIHATTEDFRSQIKDIHATTDALRSELDAVKEMRAEMIQERAAVHREMDEERAAVHRRMEEINNTMSKIQENLAMMNKGIEELSGETGTLRHAVDDQRKKTEPWIAICKQVRGAWTDDLEARSQGTGYH
jgi:uncharacterized coiled-coil DUF342 family protein